MLKLVANCFRYAVGTIDYKSLLGSILVTTNRAETSLNFALVLMKDCMMISGPGCSKLTTSLFNVPLKFQTLISQICQYFLLTKCEKLLQCKSFSHFFNKKYQCIWLLSGKTLNELTS